MIFVILGVVVLVFGLWALLSLLFLGPKCPGCGGRMRCVGNDLRYNLNVYKCGKCGEEWV